MQVSRIADFFLSQKITVFSDSAVGNAIRELDVTREHGLMNVSKSIYDMLLLCTVMNTPSLTAQSNF